MQNLFRTHMSSLMPVEQVELAVSAIALFEDVGFTSPFEPLQEIFELGTSHTDTTGMVTQVNFIIDDALNILLQAYGIEVTESTPVAFKVELVSVVTKLEDYYLPGDILAVVNGTYDATAIMADIVQLAGVVTAEEALEYIKKVDDKLILMVKQTLTVKQELNDAIEDSTLPPLDTARVAVLNRLLKGPQGNSFSVMRELADAGARSGTAEADALIHQYIEVLSFLKPEQLALELLGLVVFSNTESKDWITKTRAFAVEFTDLMQDLRVIDRTLNEQRLFLAL